MQVPGFSLRISEKVRSEAGSGITILKINYFKRCEEQTGCKIMRRTGEFSATQVS